jgi:hypothetical protein
LDTVLTQNNNLSTTWEPLSKSNSTSVKQINHHEKNQFHWISENRFCISYTDFPGIFSGLQVLLQSATIGNGHPKGYQNMRLPSKIPDFTPGKIGVAFIQSRRYRRYAVRDTCVVAQ